MRSLVLSLALSCSISGMANHIIGGEMYYTALGNDDYEVTLKLYRECSQTAFDLTAAIGLFNSAGVQVTNFTFSLQSPQTTIPISTGNPCLTAPPNMCISMGVYRRTVHIPSGNGAHTLAYQRCCRNDAVINLDDPGAHGLTCMVLVQDAAALGADNSSPAFATYPPVALCLNAPLVVDHSATDADGDILEYELVAPYDGGSMGTPIPNPPEPPPYSNVAWAPDYSVAAMLNSEPPISIDLHTGILTLTPTMMGRFVVGVRVNEYRTGVKIGAVTRDFVFAVVPCVDGIVSVVPIQTAQNTCAGRTMTFQNNSIGGDFFHWDFGVAGLADDTSNVASPTYTFAEQGIYDVTLIANPGWPCGDTSTMQYRIFDPIQVAFEPPPTLCPDQLPVALAAVGNFTAAADIAWDLSDGVSLDPHSATAVVDFATLGSHAVQVTVNENGCSGAFADSVRVYPLPVPAFTVDPSGCVPHVAHFDNTSTAWTPLRYRWEMGDGSTSTDTLPVHVYEVAGPYDVTLTVTTDSGCVTSRTLVKEHALDVWPLPRASALVDPSITSLLHPEVTFTDQSTGAIAWDYEVEGMHYDTTFFTHVFDDAGHFMVPLTVVNEFGCRSDTVLSVFVGDHLFFAPNAFSPNGDGINDRWQLSARGARIFHLEIFDRWGRSLFTTTDPLQGWDGKDAMPGIYAFKVRLSEWGPLDTEYNGTFTLVR